MNVLVPNNRREFLEFKFGNGVIENPRYPNSRKVKVISFSIAITFVYVAYPCWAAS